MDKEELQSIVRGEIESAVNFHDSEYAAERIEALDYYLGNPLGNEVEGRSQGVQIKAKKNLERFEKWEKNLVAHNVKTTRNF